MEGRMDGILKTLDGGWMEGRMDGWMDGWKEAKAGLRIAYSNQKYQMKTMKSKITTLKNEQ